MRRRPTEHVCTTWESVNYQNVTLTVYITAINKIPFMVTTSRNKNFGTAKLIHDKTKNMIMTSITQVLHTYHARGF